MRMLGTGVLALLLWSAAPGAACPPAGHDAAALGALKARRFAVADAGERQRLAVALLDCLGDPDPALRDGLAYEALSAWMCGGHLSDPTLAGLLDRLLPMLAADGPAGYRSTAYVLANEQDDVPTRERLLPGLRAAEDPMSTKAVPFRGFAALVAAIAAFALVLQYALLLGDRWRGRAHGAVAAT